MGSFTGPRKPMKERIRNFTPAWHTVNMGTGAISILFHIFPYGSKTQAMQIIALSFLILNFALFIIITTCAVTRYLWFRSLWSAMIQHPVQSLYLGSFPMGFATILTASVGILYEHFGFGGPKFLYALWVLWWLDVSVALIICFGQLHIMFTRHSHSIRAMTTVWLLPVVTLIVASSTGGVIAQSLQVLNPSDALRTLAACFVLVVTGLAIALMMLTIYLHRLIVYGLPEGITIFSAFLPLGPMGQGGYSILVMGQLFRELQPLQGNEVLLTDPTTAQIINVICFCAAFVLWSLATGWLILAVLALSETLLTTRIPFKITFWGMVFPNGVYAVLTIQLSIILNSPFFRVWGAIYSVFTLLIWLYATARTVPSVWDGEIFQAPCLEDQNLGGRMLRHAESK
ncbi:hypothetical protein BD410DRAFT_115754 [Rickenella mellea]|uniref:C4-dicarboxylate transporter/malic acid transport protein n=1 Tax=Rickenella mellea TaxID=50990 RepID=A0A4Y7QAH9_9AGAM|nr:hypothetical protein BD410DRAFT_115754 [Rickenella mellea]